MLTDCLTVPKLLIVDSDLFILALGACAFGVIFPKIVAKISVKELSTCIFFQEFYNFWSYI